MLRSLVRPLVPDFARPIFARQYRKYLKGGHFSINDLDRQLEKYVDYDGGFYVELGANDGASQSNTYYFELKRGWRGVLVEPAPHNYLKCQELRGRNNAVHCNACVRFGFEEKFVEIKYADLMSVSVGMNSDLDSVDAHIDAGTDARTKTFSFGAIARPLNDILRDSNAPKTIDVLSLDVEGAEREVLLGVDHDEFRFKFMLIECRDVDKVKEILEPAGYSVVDQFSRHDFLFKDTRASA